MVHKSRYASFVVSQIRRSKVAIDREKLDVCCAAATREVDKHRAETKLGNFPHGGVTEQQDYPFIENSNFLYAYLIGKSSTTPHEKTTGVEHRNGFDLYRQVCQIVDAVPENAAFHMRSEVSGLTKTHGTKVSDFKSLYGFRLLLKKEYD